MTQFIKRAYNRFVVNSEFGTLTKISSNSKLYDESLYYKEIHQQKHLSKFFPRIFDCYSDDNNENHLEIEYINYKNLADKMLFEDFEKESWLKVANQIKTVLKNFQKFKVNNSSYDNACEKMYINKTIAEYEKLKNSSDFFKKFSEIEEIELNGNVYKNFESIKNDILDLIQHKLCTKKEMNVVHGDFCLSNIICSISNKRNITSLRLIDPRGSWGEKGIYGDFRYDIAKLYHSFYGCYEYLINDLFTISEKKNKFNLCYSNNNHKKVAEIFSNNCTNFFDVDSIEYELIQGTIFIGMCARHYDSEERQKAMFLTGIKILNNVLQKA